MTALNLVDGQYRFEGANGETRVIGRETPYRVINVTGLRAIGPVDSADIKRTGQHGTLRAGKRTYTKRTMQLDIVVEGQSYRDVENLMDDLFSAFQGTDDPGVFSLKRRSKEERRMECTVGRAEFVSDYDSWLGWARGSIELQANDPLVYASRLDVCDIPIALTTGNGRTYNRVYNLVYAGLINTPICEVVNRGNVSTSFIWIVEGPFQNPGLKLISTGEEIQIDLLVPDGDRLEVDFDLHSILLNGSSRRTALNPSSTWWKIPPGDSRIFMTGQALGSDASSEIQLRSAWVSA